MARFLPKSVPGLVRAGPLIGLFPLRVFEKIDEHLDRHDKGQAVIVAGVKHADNPASGVIPSDFSAALWVASAGSETVSGSLIKSAGG